MAEHVKCKSCPLCPVCLELGGHLVLIIVTGQMTLSQNVAISSREGRGRCLESVERISSLTSLLRDTPSVCVPDLNTQPVCLICFRVSQSQDDGASPLFLSCWRPRLSSSVRTVAWLCVAKSVSMAEVTIISSVLSYTDIPPTSRLQGPPAGRSSHSSVSWRQVSSLRLCSVSRIIWRS